MTHYFTINKIANVLFALEDTPSGVLLGVAVWDIFLGPRVAMSSISKDMRSCPVSPDTAGFPCPSPSWSSAMAAAALLRSCSSFWTVSALMEGGDGSSDFFSNWIGLFSITNSVFSVSFDSTQFSSGWSVRVATSFANKQQDSYMNVYNVQEYVHAQVKL